VAPRNLDGALIRSDQNALHQLAALLIWLDADRVDSKRHIVHLQLLLKTACIFAGAIVQCNVTCDLLTAS
jgi:hypothetical protein